MGVLLSLSMASPGLGGPNRPSGELALWPRALRAECIPRSQPPGRPASPQRPAAEGQGNLI